MDQLPRLGKRGIISVICLLLFTCDYVVSVLRGFLFLWVLGMGYVILLWHSLSLPYNYFVYMSSFGFNTIHANSLYTITIRTKRFRKQVSSQLDALYDPRLTVETY